MTISLESVPDYLDKKYVIDVSNICNIKKDSSRKAILEVFDDTLHYLQSLGVKSSKIISFSDASFRYHVNNIEKYKEYVKCEKIIEIPAGIKSKKVIIAYCLKHLDAVIISQDLFREYYKYLPNPQWIVEKRICVITFNDDFYLIPMVDSIAEDIIPKKVEKHNKEYSKRTNVISERTTMDVLRDIEDTDNSSGWNLFDP